MREVVSFPPFELDRRSGELRKHGSRIRLADQPLQILLLLLDRPGDVISRDEIRQRLWSSDTFVDFDASLSSAVRKLRDALGDTADRPRYVETIPKRGFRFVGTVATPDIPSPVPVPTAIAPPPVPAPRIRSLPAALLVLAVTTGVLFLLYAADARSWRLSSAAPSIQTVAVLPFANLTGDATQEYFADGMTEALTSLLAQVGNLQVISRTSAMQYKHTTKRVPDIGRELTADALVEGSFVRTGDHLRVTVQVIQAATDRHVWSRQFEGEVATIASLQDQIATAIAGAVGGRSAPSPSRPPQVNPRAYDAYLKGLSAQGKGSPIGLRTSIAYFEEAIAEQPDFAPAHAELAQSQLQFVYGGQLAPTAIVPKAEAEARRAVELDDTLALGHRVLGVILHNYYWRWDEGDREMKRALGSDANAVEPLTQGALTAEGRFTDAIAQAERARRRDPLSVAATMNVGAALRAAGRNDAAIAEFRRSLTMDPSNTRAHLQIGVTLGFMNKWPEAIQEIEIAVKKRPDITRFSAYLGYAHAMAGDAPAARRILADLEARAKKEYVSSFGIALLHDVLGEKELAIAALQRAYDEHAVEFAQPGQYPAFQSVKGDPRFEALMRLVRRPG
ncbi:MAG TPA: tetratricopeptide repeat protein [Vicinamibacterales bacterium]|nr:tetratricopeptide repeat protein [Vicinamibacterales bacterium]